MKLDIGKHTDPGPREGVNQDSLLVADAGPDVTLLLVADGMGGARAGEKASQEAVRVIRDHMLTTDDLPTLSDAGERLKRAIEMANRSIYEKAQSSPEMEGMGCTIVAVLILEDLYWVASVGDSRVYLIRDGDIIQLTDDHTWVNARVREGVLTPEQAANHSLRHVLDRALGTRPTVDVDLRLDEIFEVDDALVLCTDGLYGVLEDAEIAQSAAAKGAQNAADQLVQQALSAHTHDNVSVVVLQINEV